MDSTVLANLISEVMTEDRPKKLDADRTKQFHREFEENISPFVERMRAKKRQAYEEIKNIAVR